MKAGILGVVIAVAIAAATLWGIYNHQDLEAAGVPFVAAHSAFLNQTDVIPSTNVYTVPTTGTFRVTVYASAPVADPFFELTANLGWSDEFGANSQNTLVFGPGTPLSATQNMHCVAGSTINFFTFVSGGTPALYDARVFVERLGD